MTANLTPQTSEDRLTAATPPLLRPFAPVICVQLQAGVLESGIEAVGVGPGSLIIYRDRLRDAARRQAVVQ